MRKIINFISGKPLLVSILVLIPLCIALNFITKKYFGGYDENFYRNILINLYSIPVEIFVFGILILYLNNFREKQAKIQSYQDEIDDLKTWESEEAKYKIIGCIKRLNKENISNIDLSDGVFKNYSFDGLNLQGAIFENAKLIDCSFNGVWLHKSNFTTAILNNCDFSNAICIDTIFENSDMKEAIFHNTDLRGANMKNCENLTKEQIIKAKYLNGIILEESIKREIDGMTLSSGNSQQYWRKPKDSINNKLHLKK